MRKERRKDSYVKAAKKTKEERREKRNKSRIFAPDTKGRFVRLIEKVLGVLCMAIGTLAFLAFFIQSRHYGTGHSFTHYFCTFVCVAGALLYLKVYKDERRMTRFRYYRSFMEEKEYMKLSDISAITGRTIPFLQKDLSKMIHGKLFLQADMNRDGTCLFLTKDAFRRYQRGQLIITANAEAEETRKEADSETIFEENIKSTMEEEKETVKEQTSHRESTGKDYEDDKESAGKDYRESVETDYEGYLHSLDYRLTQIHDAQIKKSVSDICIRGQQLLYFKDTNMSKEVVRFLEYFLPVTDQILETYMELEKEGLEDQAVDLKVNLNTIQHSFDLLVEKLIEGKRVDVEEEIAAVKLMLSNH